MRRLTPNSRAECALRAIKSEYRDSDLETNIVDLLADIRHLCDKRGLPFGTLNRLASMHFTDERTL